MKKLDNWESKLSDFIVSRTNTPMAWGKTDCIIFMFDAVEVQTGFDPEVVHPKYPFRGKYDSPIGGYKLLKEYSGGGLSDMLRIMEEKLELKKVEKGFAKRGDPVLINGETLIGGMRNIAGIMFDGKAVTQGEHGLVYYLRKDIVRAWTL